MEDKILAIVAGNEIKESDLERIINRYPAEQQGYIKSEKGRAQLLDQTISFELMSKFGKELGLDKTEEFQKTVEALAKELLTQVTIDKVLSEVTVTDDEIKKYYDENKSQFVEQPKVSAKHILVETEEEANSIKDEIKSESITFEEAAKKYSSCPSKENGGDLGAFGRGMMVPEFEEAAFASEIGVVTEPVKTQFGYHLILVEDKSEAKEKTFEETKDSISKYLLESAQQKKYVSLSNELAEKYGVERK